MAIDLGGKSKYIIASGKESCKSLGAVGYVLFYIMCLLVCVGVCVGVCVCIGVRPCFVSFFYLLVLLCLIFSFSSLYVCISK